ncbi:MAG: carboxypeptidase regulatory-like domain-containing protein [Terracidiphilus sp.]
MRFFPGFRQASAGLGLFIAVLLLWPLPALAQETTGSVSGVVQDTTGAVIPGAVVTVTNLDNKSERRTVSNGLGEFAIPAVTAGLRYQLRTEMKGFATWQSQPFPLRPGDRVNFTDIKMQVAAASEQVTVEATANQSLKPLDTPERSDVITAQDLDTLAIVGRDATELIEMLPGFAMVSPGVNNQAAVNTAVVGLNTGITGAFSANGAGPTGLATVLDGVSIQDIDTNAGTVQSVNSDMIQEIKATTSTFSSEYAKGPAVLNATTKAGSSGYHGEAYLYGRDTVLNANDWYNNYLQQTRPPGRYLYPGGQLGGPLWIPRTRFGPHNTKLFFFAGYEKYNQNYWGGTLGSWVPTMAERKGDFSAASLNSELCGARPDGKVNLDAVLPMCYANNYLPTGAPVANGNVAAYSNSSGVALVNWLPLPNANPFVNEQGYNYVQEVIQNQNGSQFHARVDFNLNDYNKFYATWGRQAQITDEPVAWGYFPNNSIEYPGQITSGDISNVFSFHYIRTFGSSVTNEVSASMSFISDPANEGNPNAVSRFHMNDYNCTNPSERASGTCNNPAGDNFDYLGEYKNNYDYSVPALSDYSSLGYPNMLMPGGFYNNQIKMKKVVPTLSDTVDWVKGSHSFAFGVYAERGVLNGDADYAAAFPQGEYTFNPGSYLEYNGNVAFAATDYVACENPDPGGTNRLSGAAYFGSCFNPVAMMYQGYADSFTQTNFSPIVDMQYTSLAGYANDSWKLHRVTLMLGARVEHLGPWFDRHGNGLATFSPSLYSSECGGTTRNCSSLAMPGIAWHKQDTGVANSVNQPPMIYFSPRVGAAWDIFGTSNTVLRGGWGVYRNQEQFSPYALAAATAQGYKTSESLGILDFNLVDDQSPINPPDINVATLSATDKERPVYYQYNLTVDQRLMWRPIRNSLLEFAYVGSKSQNLPTFNSQASGYNEASDLNVLPIGSYFQSTFSTANLPASIIAPNTGNFLGNLSTAEEDFYRTYPFYQHIYTLKHDFYANYNSLQVSWNRNGNGILTWGANYTFSKDLATAASYNNNLADPLNLRNDYNPAPFDRSQVFNVHYLVNLGRRYGGGNSFLSKVANDWQISGISTVQSGPDLPSEQGENFSFGYGNIQVTRVYMPQQLDLDSGADKTCANTYNIAPDKAGHTYCVTNFSPVVWMGTPDYLLMPAVNCNPAGGKAKDQYMRATCFGVPLPGSATTGSLALSTNPTGQGQYRLPYIHGPAFLNNNLSVYKAFSLRESRTLQFSASAFNFLNHPLVSFNNNDSSNLDLGNLLGAVPGQSLTQAELGYKNFGIANVKYGSRLMELSAKFKF